MDGDQEKHALMGVERSKLTKYDTIHHNSIEIRRLELTPMDVWELQIRHVPNVIQN